VALRGDARRECRARLPERLPGERPQQHQRDERAADREHAALALLQALPPCADHDLPPATRRRPPTPPSLVVGEVISALSPRLAMRSRTRSSVVRSGARSASSRVALWYSIERTLTRVSELVTGPIRFSTSSKPPGSVPPRNRAIALSISACGSPLTRSKSGNAVCNTSRSACSSCAEVLCSCHQSAIEYTNPKISAAPASTAARCHNCRSGSAR